MCEGTDNNAGSQPTLTKDAGRRRPTETAVEYELGQWCVEADTCHACPPYIQYECHRELQRKAGGGE